MLHSQDPDNKTYLQNFPNVFAFCSGTSFYSQVVPSDSVDVGFSATAMHWLSKLPCNITDHVHAVGARGQELIAFEKFALADWERILLARSKELVSGGVLVMANFCIDEQGRYLGNTEGINMFDTFDALWRDLVKSGTITEEEYVSTTFPQFYKSLDQFCSPFNDQSSPVIQSGLRLECAYTGVTKCPYRASFEEHRDADKFSEAYVPTLRSWSETVFMGGLNTSRPLDERRTIVEQFFDAYKALVREDPDNHSMDYVHTYMVIVKD